MRQTLKIVSYLLLGLLALVLIALVVLVTFVNPNRFKPLLEAQAYTLTGRQLTIDGDLTWTLFPYLGVKVGHTILHNRADYPQSIFIELSQAKLSVKLLPLLRARIESNGLTVSGLTLNLYKRADGNANWQTWPLATRKTNGAASVPANTGFALLIAGIDIKNAVLHLRDDQAKQYMDLTNISLHAKDIGLNQAFPVVARANFAQKMPALTGTLVLQGDMNLELAQQVYKMSGLRSTLTLRYLGRNYSVQSSGDLTVDLQQATASLTHWLGKMANLTLTGSAEVTHLDSQPQLVGRLYVQPFDLKQWLTALGYPVPALQVAQNVRGKLNVTGSLPLTGVLSPFAILQGFTAQALLQADAVQFARLQMSHVSVAGNLKNNRLAITPITASMYQGSLQAQLYVNLLSARPSFVLQSKLIGMQALPLTQNLQDPESRFLVSGVAHADLQITTAGMNTSQLVKNLNGTGHFKFNNGILKGVDLHYLINRAYAYINPQADTPQDTGQTSFGDVTGSLLIQKGVARNSDLIMDSSQFNLTGQGNIDFVQQKLDYQLQAAGKAALLPSINISPNWQDFRIPISIDGSLNNPNIRLNTGALLKSVAKHQLQSVKANMQDRLSEQLLPDGTNQMLQNFFGNS